MIRIRKWWVSTFFVRQTFRLGFGCIGITKRSLVIFVYNATQIESCCEVEFYLTTHPTYMVCIVIGRLLFSRSSFLTVLTRLHHAKCGRIISPYRFRRTLNGKNGCRVEGWHAIHPCLKKCRVLQCCGSAERST